VFSLKLIRGPAEVPREVRDSPDVGPLSMWREGTHLHVFKQTLAEWGHGLFLQRTDEKCYEPLPHRRWLANRLPRLDRECGAEPAGGLPGGEVCDGGSRRWTTSPIATRSACPKEEDVVGPKTIVIGHAKSRRTMARKSET